jgi:hypothetical protein
MGEPMFLLTVLSHKERLITARSLETGKLPCILGKVGLQHVKFKKCFKDKIQLVGLLLLIELTQL